MNNVYANEAHVPDNLLIMGQVPTVTDTVMVGAGDTLERGSVVGLQSDTKEAYLIDKTKTDGTQIPYGVILETVSSSGTAPYEAVVYIMGEFNADALVVAPDSTIEDYRYDMNKAGLIVRNVQNRGI